MGKIELECICDEINSRHCQYHQLLSDLEIEKTSMRLDRDTILADYLAVKTEYENATELLKEAVSYVDCLKEGYYLLCNCKACKFIDKYKQWKAGE